ncbi:tripartite tricarboxylate transporter substrate binding protein [Ancylobacter sp. TS-1]|uniref:Bug family tripartite tricarboxylate transporter substrate binding protein n=1 Tax=Ancylobacter sp. TS-1 TaxID=1850374 RepID=UPI001265BACB|nr:tripartite tricarboxylate transporter substrate binding protein [Ancylobacter sp. TS-1]QFR34393.1 tripartite tricarboxylate transporter substrate binding protein [Ancylobacter sp. TS-1]
MHRLFFATALAALLALSPARAQQGAPDAARDFPTRPVTLDIPFPAGGSTDLVGRLIAEGMGAALGQPVVVENRGGGGGSLGTAHLAKQPPDGYAVMMGTVSTHALNPALYRNLPYDPVTGFAPVSLLVIVPNALVVHPSFPANTLAEFIAELKANPGTYSYASAGNGTPGHLSGELFKSMAGVDMQHIPYQGAGPALVDVISGQVPIMFDNLPTASGYIRSGKLKALGVTTLARAPSFPDLPAVAETLPGYETYSWNALFAPAGTPPAIVDKLNAAALKALAAPKVQARLADFSAVTVGSTPQALGEHVRREVAKWAPIVKASGARLD